ncbi:hypothetical protein CB1_000932060 [Camelus ferus]|nr:hypothetical protein CB1_000932060 [Camelus ferus]
MGSECGDPSPTLSDHQRRVCGCSGQKHPRSPWLEGMESGTWGGRGIRSPQLQGAPQRVRSSVQTSVTVSQGIGEGAQNAAPNTQQPELTRSVCTAARASKCAPSSTSEPAQSRGQNQHGEARRGLQAPWFDFGSPSLRGAPTVLRIKTKPFTWVKSSLQTCGEDRVAHVTHGDLRLPVYEVKKLSALNFSESTLSTVQTENSPCSESPEDERPAISPLPACAISAENGAKPPAELQGGPGLGGQALPASPDQEQLESGKLQGSLSEQKGRGPGQGKTWV